MALKITRPDENSETDPLDNDLLLMSRIALGNVEAFRTVLDLYTLPVFHFSLSLLQDKHIAEDITQETCLSLWKFAPSWEPTGRIKSWLFRVAHNLSIDEIRKRKPHLDIETLSESLAEERQKGGAQILYESDVSRIVREALSALPVRQRAALMLIHYDDYSNIEGADIMGVSVDAFESLLARGRSALKDKLKKHKDKFWEG